MDLVACSFKCKLPLANSEHYLGGTSPYLQTLMYANTEIIIVNNTNFLCSTSKVVNKTNDYSKIMYLIEVHPYILN